MFLSIIRFLEECIAEGLIKKLSSVVNHELVTQKVGIVFAFKYIGANCGGRLKTKGEMLFKMMLSVLETGQLPGFR